MDHQASWAARLRSFFKTQHSQTSADPPENEKSAEDKSDQDKDANDDQGAAYEIAPGCSPDCEATSETHEIGDGGENSLDDCQCEQAGEGEQDAQRGVPSRER
ncbi:MAG: hypothetical protein E6H86_08590 [Chloroflexi bacterium]|nr:MAG: hypothetical protein E6H86_08590 [Chloroflexota bacterium]